MNRKRVIYRSHASSYDGPNLRSLWNRPKLSLESQTPQRSLRWARDPYELRTYY